MSATRPQPVISGAPGSDYEFSDLPVASLSLSSSSSVPSTGGSSITARLWTLASKPEGSLASITNSTSSTCELINIDLPGTYVVHLKVTDNLGRVSLDAPYAKQNTGTYLIEEPETTSVVEIRAKAENTGLVMPGTYSRGYTDRLNGWLKEIDRISPLNSIPMRGAWVQAHDGSELADGSPARPFNPNSATYGGFAGPIEQALDYLSGLDLTDDPQSGTTLFMLGGEYTENIDIVDATAPWQILCLGQVYFSNSSGYLRYTVAASGRLSPPNLLIGKLGTGAFVHAGQLRLGDSAGGSAWSLIVDDATIGSIVVSGSLASGLQLYLRHCTFISAAGVNLPNATAKGIEFCRFMYGITCKYVDRAVKSIFASVTVTQTSGADDSGFSDCGWEGTPTFTGPAGAAIFDPVTAARFFADGGSFSGGAGVDDALKVGQLVYNKSGGDFIVKAADAPLNLSTTGTNRKIGLTTTDGPIDIQANGTGRALTLRTGDGNILLEAIVNTAATVTAQAAGGVVVETVGSSSGDVIVRVTGSGTGFVVLRGRTGVADLRTDIIESDTNNAGVTARGRGTHTADLRADEIREDTTDAGVTVEDVLIKDGQVDGYDLSTQFAIISAILATIPVVTESRTHTQATATTSEELLWSISAPNPASGAKIAVVAKFIGAGNTNSKTYTIKIGSTVIATLSTTTSNDVVEIGADLTITGTNTQITGSYFILNGGRAQYAHVLTTYALNSGISFGMYATTGTVSGDVTLKHTYLSVSPAKS